MRFFYSSLFLCFSLFACTNSSKSKEKQDEQFTSSAEVDFDEILDSFNLKGSILIYHPSKNTYYSNDFEWAKRGHLPASTFKIPNSMIALETGAIQDTSTMIYWDGVERQFDSWNQDLSFYNAFHYSCLPCYQQLTRKTGIENMKTYAEKFDYGNMDIDSTNFDSFWVEGNSTITQFEQIDFLERFVNQKLPISNETYETMRELMVISDENFGKLSGKTGWSFQDENNNGWFVGFIEKGEDIKYFATNVEPIDNNDLILFRSGRKSATIEALKSKVPTN